MSASPAGLAETDSGIYRKPANAYPLPMDSSDPLTAPLHWETVLRPHRSLPPSGFLALMLCLAAVSFVSGVVFVMIGAWPVCGFFGLDVLLVYVLFRLNYRGARMREVLRLEGGDLTVERIGVRGDRRFWRMQAFWLRVELVEAPDGSNRLLVTTHGRSLVIGGFLTPDERRKLANELDSALRRWKTTPA